MERRARRLWAMSFYSDLGGNIWYTKTTRLVRKVNVRKVSPLGRDTSQKPVS